MASIAQSVGEGGVNLDADVRTVQVLINAHPTTRVPLEVNGQADARTLAAIRTFQASVVRLSTPDGRIDPGGRTWRALAAAPQNALTAARLKAIFPAAETGYLERVATELNTDLAAYGLGTALRQAHFFAQVRQECGPNLQPMDENLNYSPEALKKFSYYRNHPAEALQDGYDKDPVTKKIRRRAAVETIANKAYGGRIGNGGVASGDGWRFRGRGFIQVTGRENYAKVTAQCRLLYPGMDVDFVSHPDVLASSPGAERSAIGYWTMKGLHRLADMGASGADVDRITDVVNPGTDSYPARRANFTIAFNALR